MFNDEQLRYIAAICDTKRIESNAQKMITLGNLLYTWGIDFEILGGATNRIVLQIDGYAVKFAMDEQGYQDNLIEYSLSPELQPYVTKSFETNGYILIAECVEVINTSQKWELYRYEIRKVLDTLCQDYLLGDVGYVKKNMTNWGIRNGKPVILDYAYCHRATENLFTCSRCGSVLTYDSSYDVLMCTDRSGCKARYTYNERKRIQGKEVDIKMIAEQKASSIKLPEGVKQKDIETFGDKLVGDNIYVIDNPGDNYRYQKLKEDMMMKVMLNSLEGEEDMNGLTERFAALVKIAKNPQDEEAKKVLFENLSEEENIPEPVYTENYQENYMYGKPPVMRLYAHLGEEAEEPEPNMNEEDDDFDMESGFSALLQKTRQSQKAAEEKYQEDQRSQEDEYLNQIRNRQVTSKPQKTTTYTVTAQDEKPVAPVENKKPEQETKQENKPTVEEDVDTQEPKNVPTEDIPEHDEVDQVEESSAEDTKLAYEDRTSSTSEESKIFINGTPIKVGEEMNLNVGDDE